MIDLLTLDVVSHLQLPVSDVEISPNGNHLLLSGVSDGRVVDNEPEESGLYVLDADTLDESVTSARELFPGSTPSPTKDRLPM